MLGNHDLHLLAVAHGFARLRSDDTLDAVLAAPDRDALLEWLAERPLLHEDSRLQSVHGARRTGPAMGLDRGATVRP